MKVLLNLTGDTQNWLAHSRDLAIVVKAVLEAQVLINQAYLRAHKVPPIYHSGIRYREEPLNIVRLGGHAKAESVEEFANIPAIIERGWGDCFPEHTCLLGEGNHYVPIENVEVGQRIWGLHDWTTVEAKEEKGVLAVTCLITSTRESLFLTESHHAYVLVCPDHFPKGVQCNCPTGARAEVRSRVRDLQVGMVLVSPYRKHRHEPLVKITEIMRGALRVPCWDIQTTDHRVYLPDTDVTVSNCDDIAPWRCAELREHGERARIKVSWRRHHQTAQRVFHVLVRRGDNSVEDPCAKLGMPTGAPERRLGLA